MTRDEDDRPAATPAQPHAPSTDPWKGLRGIMSGTLIMEAISLGLVLTVIARIDDGAHLQPWRVVYVAVLAIAMVLACGLQKRSWALAMNLTLAGLAVLGWIVHPSMAAVGLIFAAVWAYLLYLRRDLRQRIAGGYLASQHD